MSKQTKFLNQVIKIMNLGCITISKDEEVKFIVMAQILLREFDKLEPETKQDIVCIHGSLKYVSIEKEQEITEHKAHKPWKEED